MSRRNVFAIAVVALLVLLLGAGSALLLLARQTASVGRANSALRLPDGTPDVAARTAGETASPTGSEPAEVFTPAITGVSTQTPTPPPTLSPTQGPTDTPYPTLPPERYGGPVPQPNNHPGVRWVALQAGHWHNDSLPTELSHLMDHTGAYSAGVSEVDLNVEIAKLTAKRLSERGYSVDVLDATVPPNYTSDLFLAIHADGSDIPSLRGFKAVPPWGGAPQSDKFVSLLYEEYGKATGLPVDARTSAAMANYYAFNPLKYRHAINMHVPAALLEMGFVTNGPDRTVLTKSQDAVAWGIANAVDRFFRSGALGDTPTPYPSFTPTATRTPTQTSTSTPSLTATPTTTSTPTPLPPEIELPLTETAAVVTPVSPTRTPRLPTMTRTPLPTSTPLTGTITLDGRWLAPVVPNGRYLPPAGSKAAPVLLGWENDDPHDGYMVRRADWKPHVWWQYFIPRLGRSIWVMGQAIPAQE